MDNKADEINFTLIAASRGRYESLKRFINSVFTLAHNPKQVELWIMSDNDDVETHQVVEKICREHFPSWNIILGKRERSTNLNRDYINVAAEQSAGKYLWVLGDDVEILSVGWDSKLKFAIENFIYENDIYDRLCYIYIDDDIHKPGEVGGCCFPVITRESYNAVGFYMPAECTTWGADHYLWLMYSNLKANRLLDLRGGHGARLAHHAYHTGKAPRDEISYNIERNVSHGNIQLTLGNYIGMLNDKIS